MKTLPNFLSSFIALFLLSSTILNAQTQLGEDINGESSEDYASFASLSADGNRVAIGAPFNSDSLFYAGRVRVFEYNGSSWLKLGNDIDGKAELDQFGFSVALSVDGSIFAAGVSKEYTFGHGYVSIFKYNGIEWIQLGEDIEDEVSGDYDAGSNVSLSSNGNRIAIGAPYNDGNGNHSGHVRVFEFNGSNWIQLGNDIDGEAAGDLSGKRVSLSSTGSRVAIGAFLNDGNGIQAGHVRVFEYSGTEWIQFGNDIDGEASGDHSGMSISLSSSGNRIAIGAPRNEGNGNHSGNVRIYEYSGGDWNKLGNDIDGEAAGDHSGESISLSADGNIVAIGALFNNGNGTNAGHVRIYEYIDENWIQVGTDFDGAGHEDLFGENVSISADGQRVAIGARGHDTFGHVRVFGEIPVATHEIKEPQLIEFTLSPNPTTGILTILGITPTDKKISIMDATGKIIKVFQTSQNQIDLSDFPVGLYFILIFSNDQTIVKKVIKD